MHTTFPWLVGVALAFGFVAASVSPPVRAGEYNQVLTVGDAGPSWENLPGVDGKSHALKDLASKQVVVLVFTCNSCPVAQDYEERIASLAKRYEAANSPVAVVAVNVNLIEEDRLPAMQERARERGFAFPYLFDETQKIARDYGATYTPEFFVLDAQRRVVYMGGMDDNSNSTQVTTNYLDPAIDAALAGTAPQVKETVARGCTIRYARTRRKTP